MEMHVIIGGVLFAAALASDVVVLILIAVAAMSPARKTGPENPGRLFEAPAGGLSPKKGTEESAQCYWDCMDGFHWASGWGKQCAVACSVTEKA